jgi:thermitase
VDGDADPTEVGSHAANPTYGHGTMVAGLVALAAPGARIMPLRVLDANGVGNVWVLAEALQYAMLHGAQVVNLSLSMPTDNRVLRDVLNAVTCAEPPAVDDLPCYRSNGAVVIEAAGNFATQTPCFPGGLLCGVR